MIDPRTEGRLWLVVTSTADGGSTLRITRMEPDKSAVAMAMLRVRGKSALDDQVITIPPKPVAGLQKVELTATLNDAYALGLATGVDRKRIACAGLKTTDSLIVQPAGIPPVGYAIIDVVCTENGWARVGFSRPSLAIGANNAIPLKITAFR